MSEGQPSTHPSTTTSAPPATSMNQQNTTATPQLSAICKDMNKLYRGALKHISSLQPEDPEGYITSLEAFVLKAKVLETLLIQQQVKNAERLVKQIEPQAEATSEDSPQFRRARLESQVLMLRKELTEKDALIEKVQRRIRELSSSLETLLNAQIEAENRRYEE